MTTPVRDQVGIHLEALGLHPEGVVGSLVREHADRKGVISFRYDPVWLANAHSFPIDPELGLFEGEQFLPVLAGVFQDAAPDRWGRTLMERREAVVARREGRPARTLDEWDFLLGVDDETRQGALRLSRDGTTFLAKSGMPVPPVTRLRELEEMARRHEADDLGTSTEADRWVEMLVDPGSSLGGTRPKANFRDPDGSLWIAKFPSRGDRRDVARWEYLLTDLADRAAIAVPEAGLIQLGSDHGTFCSRRFDRSGPARHLYASAMTLTGRSDGEHGSYLDIVQAIETYGVPSLIDRDLEQLFRRLIFNVMMGNRDDHLRNHGFLRTQDGWRLSPVFDVNPEPEKFEHSLSIDGRDHSPDMDLVLETAQFYRLSKGRAAIVFREVSDAVASWQRQAKERGISLDEIDFVASSFDT